MTDQYIEKVFLYFVVLSLLVHAVIFSFLVFMPGKKQVIREEPYMVELEDMPQLKDSTTKNERETKRHSAIKNRVNKEVAPKGEMSKERIASLPRNIPRLAPQTPVQTQQKSVERSMPHETGVDAVRKVPRGGDLLKERKDNLPELAKLYPNANGLSSLEENYRKKYGSEVKEGETKFLDTDDILFGSFLRRFETAVYGVWRYPSDAVRLGIEGVTPVKITFNKKGEIENVQLLESSGSKILDNEVFRTLRLIGPMGSFPKGYSKDKFNLIAFFQYGISRGASRGVLH